MLSIFGNRKCIVSREMTKYYETFYRGNLKNIFNKNLNIPTEENDNGPFVFENEKLKKIFSFSKNKISTKHLASILSIIYKKPKKFFYSQAIKYIK